MKKNVVLSVVAVLISVTGAFALDRDTIKSYQNQVQSLQSDFKAAQSEQQSLLKTKDLLSEMAATDKSESAKLKAAEAEFTSDVASYKADRSAADSALRAFQSEIDVLKGQRENSKAEIDAFNSRHAQHDSWKPDPYNHSAVSAYNAEADRLDAEAAALNARKASLDADKNRLLAEAAELDRNSGVLEQRRKALIDREKALKTKESDLEWARKQMSEQTLKWAEETKRNNARLNDIAAQLNALLTKIARSSSKCTNISGVGTLDLQNLNGASEQALGCLQQLWDGASRKSKKRIAPVPQAQMQ
ncbi:MAG TPA: hypothetical protein VI298_15610 [Geobacteraceae bacterium]